MRIAVAMSGGVDSSVAALLMRENGHAVTGVYMKIWDGQRCLATSGKHSCYGPDEYEDIKDAEEVCRVIGIPFHTFNCVRAYERIVLEYFKAGYQEGRTPNPCVRCNQLMKFGVFYDTVRSSGITFDRFATGHYARSTYSTDTKRFLLLKAHDKKKDQSYFLYGLSQRQLATALFPVGENMKEEVRDIARAKGLPVYDKQESQDFYHGNLRELFDSENLDGFIVDRAGKVLGSHRGIWNYTLGQRRRLGLASPRPLYVIGLNKERNEVVVGYENETYRNAFTARNINWIAQRPPKRRISVKAKIRSSHDESDAWIKLIGKTDVRVEFSAPQKAISPGQSVVFYDEDKVIGGGIIHG